MSRVSQTVFRFTSRHGFDGLQSFQEPIPSPGLGEVLVKVRGIGLNYRDIAIAYSQYPFAVKDSVIPCADMAGTVMEIGPHFESSNVNHVIHTPPTSLAVGDSVTATLSPTGLAEHAWGGVSDGFLCEYVVLPSDCLVKSPEKCTTTEGFMRLAGRPVVVGTAWNSLYGLKPLKAGDTVLALGTGGVSLTAVTLAKAAGATTIITSSSDEKLEFVKTQYGVDHVINYKTHPNWAAEVMRITNNQGVHQVIEIGGQGSLQQSVDCTAREGIISVIGFLAPADEAQSAGSNISASVLNKACIIRGILGGSKQQLEDAYRFMKHHNLDVHVDKTFGFTRDEVISSLKYLESGAHIGKVCISTA